jgi:hypothetical protein
MEGRRFRHLAHFRRWRPDKPPQACTFDQLEVTPPQEIAAIFEEGPDGLRPPKRPGSRQAKPGRIRPSA